MSEPSRRAVLAVTAGVGGLAVLGYLLRTNTFGIPAAGAQPPMMGMSEEGMRGAMALFARHTELRRTVEEIPGGVRATTESTAPDLVAQLQGHVSSMYGHLDRGAEVSCMSQTLPTLFRRAGDYQRHLSFTPTGVVVTETSSDPEMTAVIRAHAVEVTGFVNDGMSAMMGPGGMMGGGSMMGPR